jgi:phenylalanyl-tRNA synthetase beta chain
LDKKLPKETIKKILASLDIKVNSITDAGLGLIIPCYSVDVQREIDVIEEIFVFTDTIILKSLQK